MSNRVVTGAEILATVLQINSDASPEAFSDSDSRIIALKKLVCWTENTKPISFTNSEIIESMISHYSCIYDGD